MEQNWHLVLLQSLLVLEVVDEVKDLEQRGRVLALAGRLVRELLEWMACGVQNCVMLV